MRISSVWERSAEGCVAVWFLEVEGREDWVAVMSLVENRIGSFGLRYSRSESIDVFEKAPRCYHGASPILSKEYTN